MRVTVSVALRYTSIVYDSFLAAGIFALKGRIRLTRFIQSRYVTPTAFYSIATAGLLDNPDQRVTQDVGMFN
jgi:ABC-type uncharacterized transport system fused permease/ATPase subunit